MCPGLDSKAAKASSFRCEVAICEKEEGQGRRAFPKRLERSQQVWPARVSANASTYSTAVSAVLPGEHDHVQRSDQRWHKGTVRR